MDWRFTPLVILAAVMVLLLLVLFAINGWQPKAEQIIIQIAIALFAVSLETFGYETIVNGLGKMGVGPRSDEAQLDNALLLVKLADEAGIDIGSD